MAQQILHPLSLQRKSSTDILFYVHHRNARPQLSVKVAGVPL